MSDNPAVNPLGRAVLGVPEPCPLCGGELAEYFRFPTGADGYRYPVIDPAVARCRDCWETFPVRKP